ncbi:BCCT family transporter [Halomonas dongshanensis]|uniref:BCCT family transporter n=1 Tax=Halomonas dongshanensis TaxID=2890835 RepID=A0ABT2EI34_9GAMM|nr:BCCT family transporter [Halomonas dongshanensis]MCS2611124.1 BCCT family transporter [Halomonas dongshanensis]
MQDSRSSTSNRGVFAGVDKTMAIASTAMVVAFVLFSILQPSLANTIYLSIKAFIEQQLGWYYILVVNVVLFVTVGIIVSPFGKLRLGRDHERPEFSNFTWFAMLFSAAVGTGLLFWSIAEPLNHLQGNPYIETAGIAPNTLPAAQTALTLTIFHWGLHGWAIYILVGVILAYFAYRHDLPMTIRSAFYPVLGERIHGPIGHAIDLLAIFATLFGTATTLGLGVSQMNAGLNSLFGLEISSTNQVWLVLAVTVAATVSAVSGLKKGIRLLSEWNIHVSLILFAFFVLAGPTVFLLTVFTTSLGDYASNIISMGFWTNPDPESQWQGWWTLFYWGWWLSWGPYVGMFIARISRGRTIRQVLLGGMAAAVLGATSWIVIFGGTALHLQLFGGVDLASVAVDDITTVLFQTIAALDVPWATVPMIGLATLMIITWFVTSADSGTLVICTILAKGSPHPPQLYRVIWGLGLGATAAVLLIAGGLEALQTAAIAAALPFSVALLVMCYCMIKALRGESADPTVAARLSQRD